MKYTIYQITNLINGKIYIGKHQTENPNDQYYGSGKAIKEAIRKHGKENFIKEILFVFDSEEEMNAKEKKLITEEFVARSDTYNIGVGGEGGAHFKGKKHSEETIERIKSTLSTDENKQRLIEAGRKSGLSSRGRTLSENGKRNISHGIQNSKRNISHGIQNRDLPSDETKIKISHGLREYYKNTPKDQRITKKRVRKPLSEATKQKLRERAKERKLKKGCS